jgi:hypothetical protein
MAARGRFHVEQFYGARRNGEDLKGLDLLCARVMWWVLPKTLWIVFVWILVFLRH